MKIFVAAVCILIGPGNAARPAAAALPDSLNAEDLRAMFDGTDGGAPPVAAAAQEGAVSAAESAENPGDELDRFLEAQGVPAAKRPAARRAVEELWKVLSGVGAAMGGEKSVEFRVGEWWVTDLEAGQIFLPIKEIIKNLDDMPVLVGGVAHEAGHVYWSRQNKVDAYRKLLETAEFPEAAKSFHNLMEDMWMEQAVGLRWPGAPHYIKSLHRKTESERKDPGGAGNKPLPHEEFLEALFRYWRSGAFPKDKSLGHPEARQALAKIRDAVVRFMAMVPGEFGPSEQKRVALTAERFDFIQREIYPHYLELLKLSRKQMKERQGQGKGKKGGKSQGQQQGKDEGEDEESDREIDRQIEERAARIAEKNSPTHGPKTGQGAQTAQKSVSMDPSSRSDPSQPPPPPGTTGQTNWGAQKTLDVVRELLKRKQSVLSATQPRNRYERAVTSVSALVEPLVGRLENLFTENTAPTWEGHFNSGQSVDVKKWMRSEARGWRAPEDYQVFLRRRVPTKRDYKFRLLIDLSGSMSGDRRELAIDTAVLFMETLERLKIDYSVLGFSQEAYLFKDFSEDPLEPKRPTLEQKSALVDGIGSQGGGSTHDAEAVLTALKGDAGRKISALEDQPGELRYLIVITDGEGNGPASGRMGEILAQAAENQVAVVGIGIGEGMSYVSQRYARHALVPNLEALPQSVADVLERSIREGFAPPKGVE